jgi:hypothetical protein
MSEKLSERIIIEIDNVEWVGLQRRSAETWANEAASLEASLEAYDHLLSCKRGWRWDLERRGLNMIEAGIHMIRCNKAAQEEQRE